VRDQGDFFLTLEPGVSRAQRSAKIHFGPPSFYDIRDEKNQNVDGEWPLPPKTRTKFKIILKPNNPGLLELDVVTDWNSACSLHFPVNTGFQNIVALKSGTDGFITEGAAMPDTSSANSRPVPLGSNVLEIGFQMRSDHSPITFALPPTLEISTTDDDTRLLDKGKRVTILPLTMDISGIALLQIENNRWGRAGIINIKVLKSSDRSLAIATYRIRYRTDYPGYILLLVTFLGALLYVMIESLPTLNRPPDGSPPPPYWKILLKDGGSKLVVAFCVALVVFLLKDTTVLDAIKFDPTTLKGYATLGFCTNVFGLEAIFKKIKKLIDPS
jgi:hypothetical protein